MFWSFVYILSCGITCFWAELSLLSYTASLPQPPPAQHPLTAEQIFKQPVKFLLLNCNLQRFLHCVALVSTHVVAANNADACNAKRTLCTSVAFAQGKTSVPFILFAYMFKRFVSSQYVLSFQKNMFHHSSTSVLTLDMHVYLEILPF